MLINVRNKHKAGCWLQRKRRKRERLTVRDKESERKQGLSDRAGGIKGSREGKEGRSLLIVLPSNFIMSWLPLFILAKAINYLLYGHYTTKMCLCELRALITACSCCTQSAIRGGGGLYASHLTPSAWHGGCVRNYMLLMLQAQSLTDAAANAANDTHQQLCSSARRVYSRVCTRRIHLFLI